MALNLDAYVRVSRVGGGAGEGYISPDVQREAIESYARDLGGAIVAWHGDQDYSGGNAERPGFQRVLERLNDRETDGIIVMRIDRFARSVPDGAAVVRDISDRDQVFASCHERIDPRTPEGKYMLNSFLANAELFLDQAKASWWTAKARAVARGAHIGPTPVGYERIPKGQERSGCLLPHPVYGPAIKELFKRAATGKHGDTALARWMTERAPRKGGAPWQPSEIRRWLGNRLISGRFVTVSSSSPTLTIRSPIPRLGSCVSEPPVSSAVLTPSFCSRDSRAAPAAAIRWVGSATVALARPPSTAARIAAVTSPP